eukprot:TRINITY_DN18600_c0_g1_i1.p1 TRINITY_DN18600_c0_g1~~TRINITY_DN18600_c0_g1_i1.p1  ORF type:complete len:320 (-),score=36.46 TRINITY_DN18600_c0_g1_i1:103-1062(-)
MKAELSEKKPVTRFERFVTVVTLFVFFAVLQSIPLVCMIVMIGSFYSPYCVALMIVIFFLSIYPRRIHAWPELITNPFWRYWRHYFSYKAINATNGKFDPKGFYLLAQFPHGIFPMGQWLAQSVYNKVFGKDARYTKGAGASAIFMMPLFRHIYSWLGAVDASKEELLLQCRTYNIAIIPGGVAEMMLSDKNEERIFIKKRKGFIKFALQTGLDLIPVYQFGNTQILDRLSSKVGLFTWLSRKFRASILIVLGRWYLPIPRKMPITSVYGEPIPVAKISSPSQEDIDKLHAKFQDDIVKLYETWHTKIPGYENKELVVM